MQTKPTKKIIRPLTGLRGVTILSVILMHFRDDIVALLPAVTTFVDLSNRIAFRMDLFFMLSGLIISYIYISLDEKLTFKKYRDFLLGRFIRLYPSYLAVSLTLITAVLACNYLNIPITGNYPLRAIPLRLALLQAWPFMSWGYWTWNYPTWFLSALAFGYIAVFPCAWLLVHRLRGSRYTLLWVFGPVAGWLLVSHVRWLHEFHALIRVSLEFIAGSALYVAYLEGSKFVAAAQKHLDKTTWFFAALLFIVSVVPMAIVPLIINSFLVMATPLLLAGMTDERSMVARMMASRPIMWLGKISFALFLSHVMVQKILKVLLPAARYSDAPLAGRYLVLGIYIVAVMGAAVLLHKLVEMPCANALKRLLIKRPQEKGPRPVSTIPEPTGIMVK